MKELPPRLSILLAFIVFQIISFAGVFLQLKMEIILKRALFGVVFAGILGYIMGLLWEHWQEEGLFNKEGEQVKGEGEAKEEAGEEGEVVFQEMSFPEVNSSGDRINHQKS